MPCLLGCLALLTPRVVILAVWLLSDYLGRAYDGWIWPVLGFLFMPLTTLAYAWAINTAGTVEGFRLVVVVIAVLIDLGLLGGGGREAHRRQRREPRPVN
jgi:hypothetical protein